MENIGDQCFKMKYFRPLEIGSSSIVFSRYGGYILTGLVSGMREPVWVQVLVLVRVLFFLQMAHIVIQVGAVFFATSVGIELKLSAVFQSPSLYRWPNSPFKTCPNLHHSQGALKFATQISPLLNYYLFSNQLLTCPVGCLSSISQLRFWLESLQPDEISSIDI